MMFLSRLVLEPRSRHVQRDLGDCHQMHRTIMAGFPHVEGDSGRAHFGVLFRVEPEPFLDRPVVLVQSRNEPDWSRLARGYLADLGQTPNPASRPLAAVYGALEAGRRLRFRLRANVTKKVGVDGRANGARVELRGDEAKIEWLERRAASGGFALVSVRGAANVPDVRIVTEPKQAGRQAAPSNGASLTFGSVLFEGRLDVTDAELFRRTLSAGIGPAKAYGFGLLSLAPP